MTNSAVGMPCPVCRVPLAMSDRQGVEIDYCPQCRGVWLDRGELDKIIERQAMMIPASPVRGEPGYAPGGERRPYGPDARYRAPEADPEDDDDDYRRRYG